MLANVTTAMVLAAGLGSRMRELSQTRPKPLIEVDGKSLLDRVLDNLAAAGIRKVVVNVHYLAEQIEAALANRTDLDIVISDERDARLETGGGVRNALPLLGDGPFIVQNADCFWIDGLGNNIARLAETWDPARMDCLLLMTGAASAVGYSGRGDFYMTPQGLATRRKEREDAPFIFAGASIATAKLFDNSPSGAFSLNAVWDQAIDRERLFGVRMDGLWMHVGTPEAICEAEHRLRNPNG